MTEISIKNIRSMTEGLLLGCVGYERRSIHVLQNESLCPPGAKLLFDYNSKGILSYDENYDFAKSVATLEADFDLYIERIRSEISGGDGTADIYFDITSFDRKKMAEILELLFKNSKFISSVTLIYAPSKFIKPHFEFGVTNSFGPVIPELMGDSAFDKDKLALIVGAGYEFGRVVGAIDTLEPRKVVCFRPTGTDPRYDSEIDRANLNFGFLDSRDAILSYEVTDVFALYYNLRRVIEQLDSEYRVLVLPLGPKIFAAISILIAMVLHPRILVWRHSTVDTRRPDSITDAESSGETVSFTFGFGN